MCDCTMFWPRWSTIFLIALDWEAIIVNVCVFFYAYFLLDRVCAFIWLLKWLVLRRGFNCSHSEIELLFEQSRFSEWRWQDSDSPCLIPLSRWQNRTQVVGVRTRPQSVVLRPERKIYLGPALELNCPACHWIAVSIINLLLVVYKSRNLNCIGALYFFLLIKEFELYWCAAFFYLFTFF